MKEIRVLLIEDSVDDAVLLVRQLTKAGYQVLYERVDTHQKMDAELDARRWDIVISDFTLPLFDAIAALELVRRKQPDVPLIIVSGTIGEERAVAAMRAGASDYIFKGTLTRLIPAVERTLREAEVRRNEQRLIAERQTLLDRFQTILDRMPIGCVMTDSQFRYVYWNPAAEGIFGFKLDEVRGKHPFEVIVPEKTQEEVQNLFERAQGGDLTAHRVGENLTKSGRTVLCEWNNTPLQNHDGTFSGVLSMCQDITERRSLEEQLRQAQKMESIGRLAGGIAHDFNNILTVIHGFSQQLLEGNLSSADNEACQQVCLAAERASQLTKQLLTFSRRQVYRPQLIDLNELLGQLVRMLIRMLGEDVILSSEYSVTPAIIRADPGMVEQVVMNLAVNARDAMIHGCELRIQTSVVWIDTEYVATHPEASEGHHVCLAITDTGCGIPEEDLPHIFEPFFTTKEVGKGTGLGLATVFGIVKQHQGWIEVSSRLGCGTQFQIYFPAATGERQKVRLPDRTKARGKGETLLLVEDEYFLRNMVRSFLENTGYRVLEAASGPEAWHLWEDQKSRIDLLITDIVMPGGLTGNELVRRMRAERPELNAILVSGYNADTLSESFQGKFLQKPFSLVQMARTIRDLLDTTTTIS